MSRTILRLVIVIDFSYTLDCFPLTSNNYNTTSIAGIYMYSDVCCGLKKLSCENGTLFSAAFYLRNYSSCDREGEVRFVENRIENI